MPKWSVGIGWSDVPHISEEDKAELLAATPPYMRAARTEGIPQLGSGVIFPVDPERYLVTEAEERALALQSSDGTLPDHWPRAYGMDVGWNRTAAVWGAYERSTDTVWLYSEYYASASEPPIHAEAVKARGAWIPGVMDPASQGRNQKDGTRLIDEYRASGLDLTPADNSVEAGIAAVWRRLSTGRLRVMRRLVNWQNEIRLYRRDEDGKIVKKDDHLMDCFSGDTRVLTPSGPIAFADLPASGLVMGPRGRWVRYRNAGVMRRQAECIALRFAEREIVCTPDHLFRVKGRWVPAVDMLNRAPDNAIPRDVRKEANTGKEQCAPSPVVGVCLEIRDASKMDVYCLEAPGPHAFALEGGEIVHNCSRYLIMSGMQRATVKVHEADYDEPRRASGRQRKTGY